MLSTKNRFHSKSAVRRVLAKGKPYRGRHIIVRSVASNHPTARVSVIISKKVYKSAVKRNRIRRRIYNIVRHEISNLSTPRDITITVFSPETLIIDHTSLQLEVKTLLQPSIYGQ